MLTPSDIVHSFQIPVCGAEEQENLETTQRKVVYPSTSSVSWLVHALLTPNLFIFLCSIHRVKNCCGSSLQLLYCWSCTLLQGEVCLSPIMPFRGKCAATIITALRATKKYSQPSCMGSVQYYAALNIYF